MIGQGDEKVAWVPPYVDVPISGETSQTHAGRPDRRAIWAIGSAAAAVVLIGASALGLQAYEDGETVGGTPAASSSPQGAVEAVKRTTSASAEPAVSRTRSAEPTAKPAPSATRSAQPADTLTQARERLAIAKDIRRSVLAEDDPAPVRREFAELLLQLCEEHVEDAEEGRPAARHAKLERHVAGLYVELAREQYRAIRSSPRGTAKRRAAARENLRTAEAKLTAAKAGDQFFAGSEDPLPGYGF